MCKRNEDIVVADTNIDGDPMAGLIIFILVILQFKRRNGHNCAGHNQLFDNSTLFILVLFCVVCCGKVKLGC